MAKYKNNIFAALVLTCASVTPVLAEDYDAMSHSDGISLSAGDATRANMAIQTVTPWPVYINNTVIYMRSKRAADLMEIYLSKYAAPPAATGGTTININPPAQ